MEPKFVKAFEIRANVDKPIFIGQDRVTGRRQLIKILDGRVSGAALPLNGALLSGGVDSQLIRPDGRAEISARYGVRLDDGRSFYIQNDGIRTVPPEYAATVLAGEIAPAGVYYFCTKPEFEIYDDSLAILKSKLFVCCAERLPDSVVLGYYMIEVK